MPGKTTLPFNKYGVLTDHDLDRAINGAVRSMIHEVVNALESGEYDSESPLVWALVEGLVINSVVTSWTLHKIRTEKNIRLDGKKAAENA